MQRSPEEPSGREEVQAPPAEICSATEEQRKADEHGFKLFLGNLGLEVDEAFLTRVFSKFSSFVPGSERVKRDKDGKTLCFGYTNFSKRKDAVAATEEFNDEYMGSCRVRLSWSANTAGATRHLSQEQLQQRLEARRKEL